MGKGITEPSVTRVGLVAAILNCNLEWLITGQGDQTLSSEKRTAVTNLERLLHNFAIAVSRQRRTAWKSRKPKRKWIRLSKN